MAMVQPRSMRTPTANAMPGYPHQLAPRRHLTTLFTLIASIQTRHGADEAVADALVMQLLREQPVTFLNAAVWHEVAVVSED